MAKSPIKLTNEQRLKVYEYALQEIDKDIDRLKSGLTPATCPITGLCYAFNFGLRMALPENPVIQIAFIDKAFLQKAFPEIFIKYRPADYDSSVRMYWWPLTREGLEMRKNIIIIEMVNLRSITAPTPWDYNKPKPM